MQVRVILFGQLTEILGQELVLDHLEDTDGLKAELISRYPALGAMTFVMALDNRTVTGNTRLSNNSTVALLPPFSGG